MGLVTVPLILTQNRGSVAVRRLQRGEVMVSRVAHAPLVTRQDGFGTRQTVSVPELGSVEELELTSALSSPGAEQAIRARAAHFTRLPHGLVGRVLRVERRGPALWTFGEVFGGITLSDLLAALEFGTWTLSDEELLALAGSVVDAAGRMHVMLGELAHGALCPSHVTLLRDGSTVFTGPVFAEAIQSLKLDRGQVWREFGVALPPSAGVPIFDRRADVAQLGALVLAIGHRRSLRRDEFPDKLDELIASTSFSGSPRVSSRFKVWLRDALQVHGRVVFESCEDASRKFSRLLTAAGTDEAHALALRAAILQFCGNT